MPIYEFVCEDCGRLSEVMQKLTDPPPAACPECGGSRMARTVSRTSFQLKGGGWYSDLYGSPKEKPKAAAAGGDAKPAADSKGGADAKPAAGGASPAGSGSGSSASGGTTGGGSKS